MECLVDIWNKDVADYIFTEARIRRIDFWFDVRPTLKLSLDGHIEQELGGLKNMSSSDK